MSLIIQNHSLHFAYSHISERTHLCHSMTIQHYMIVDMNNCHDRNVFDLKIESRRFCDDKKHDEKSKII